MPTGTLPAGQAPTSNAAVRREVTRSAPRGDVPNVRFPGAALHDEPTGRLAIDYGAADTVTGLCFGKVDEIVEWTTKYSKV